MLHSASPSQQNPLIDKPAKAQERTKVPTLKARGGAEGLWCHCQEDGAGSAPWGPAMAQQEKQGRTDTQEVLPGQEEEFSSAVTED